MEVQVNILGVLAGAIVAMAVGGAWYGKVGFGATWMKLQKINEKKMEQNAPKAMVGMFVSALLMAYIVAHVTYLSDSFFTDYSYEYAAFSSAFWLWLGLVLPVLASGSLFNQLPWKLTAIHAGNWLVILLGMGVVIGMIGL